MALNKSTQELKKHLKGTATNLETTADEILKLASQMKEVDVTPFCKWSIAFTATPTSSRLMPMRSGRSESSAPSCLESLTQIAC